VTDLSPFVCNGFVSSFARRSVELRAFLVVI
jgi:hypothetical protein